MKGVGLINDEDVNFSSNIYGDKVVEFLQVERFVRRTESGVLRSKWKGSKGGDPWKS